MNTYFFIEVLFTEVSEDGVWHHIYTLRYGPYLSLPEANKVFLDELPHIMHLDYKPKTDVRYLAMLGEWHEDYRNNTWQRLRVIANDSGVLLKNAATCTGRKLPLN